MLPAVLRGALRSEVPIVVLFDTVGEFSSHHTVANHVAARDDGRALGASANRERITDPFLPKIEEWIEASKGRIRADKAHTKLLALGYRGSERSTRRAVAAARAAYRMGNVRVHRPWITEPGMWLL